MRLSVESSSKPNPLPQRAQRSQRRIRNECHSLRVSSVSSVVALPVSIQHAERELLLPEQVVDDLVDAARGPGVGILDRQRPLAPDGLPDAVVVLNVAQVFEMDAEV